MTADGTLSDSPAPQAATTAVLTTAAANVALAVVALATGILSARLLGPMGRGHLAAAQAVGSLVIALGSLSLGESLVFFVGRRIRPPMVVLQTVTIVATGSTTLLIVTALLLMPKILVGQPEAVAAARAYSLIGLPFVLLGLPVTFIRALQRYGLWNLLRLIGPFSWLVVLLVFTLSRTSSVQLLVIAFGASQLPFIPLAWILARRHSDPNNGLDTGLVWPMVRYGMPLFMATLPQALNLRFDQLLLANVASASQLGLYAVSVSWAGLGLPMMAAIGSVLFPKLAAMKRSEARAALASSVRTGTVLALILGVASAVSAPFLVPYLFGTSFVVPFEVPLLLAAATAVLGVNGIIEEGLRGMGEPRTVLIGESAGLAITVLILFILVPRLGITGAAVASLAGYATTCAALCWRTKVATHLDISALLIPRREDFRQMLHRIQSLGTAGRGR